MGFQGLQRHYAWMWTKPNPRGWEQCRLGSTADQGNEPSAQSGRYHY